MPHSCPEPDESMNAYLLPLFAWVLDPLWAIPVVGAAACVLAFLAGRRLLAVRLPLAPAAPPADDDSSVGVTTERTGPPPVGEATPWRCS